MKVIEKISLTIFSMVILILSLLLCLILFKTNYYFSVQIYCNFINFIIYSISNKNISSSSHINFI